MNLFPRFPCFIFIYLNTVQLLCFGNLLYIFKLYATMVLLYEKAYDVN